MERDTFVQIGEADLVANVQNGLITVPPILIDGVERDLCKVDLASAVVGSYIRPNTDVIARDIIGLINAGAVKISMVVPFLAVRTLAAACMSPDDAPSYADALEYLFLRVMLVWVRSQCNKNVRAVIESVYDVDALGGNGAGSEPAYYDVDLIVE